MSLPGSGQAWWRGACPRSALSGSESRSPHVGDGGRACRSSWADVRDLAAARSAERALVAADHRRPVERERSTTSLAGVAHFEHRALSVPFFFRLGSSAAERVSVRGRGDRGARARCGSQVGRCSQTEAPRDLLDRQFGRLERSAVPRAGLTGQPSQRASCRPRRGIVARRSGWSSQRAR